jgi:hypothetical protein
MRPSGGRSGADGARTRDLLAASQTLSQLSYGPKLRSKSSVQSAKGLSAQGTVPAAAPNRDPLQDRPRGVNVLAGALERNPFQGQSPFGDSPLTTP